MAKNYSYHDCINNCGRKTNNSSGKCFECRKEVCKKCGKKFARKINYYKELCYKCINYRSALHRSENMFYGL